MIDVFLQTVPFFAIIGLGYVAGRTGFFDESANAYLTKFVFYFALSAMLFGFASNLSLSDIVDLPFIGAYFCATLIVYLVCHAVALLRRLPVAEAAIEAQCGVIGNVGFLGIPMLVLLMGEKAIVPVMLVLSVDLLIFGSLVVILIVGPRQGRLSFSIFRTAAGGLIRNPMIVSMALGLTWSALDLSTPKPMAEFLTILGAAATPGALFAIGGSLASKSTERIEVAGWLSFSKLVLHPLAVVFFAYSVFEVDSYNAGVMVAAAALPTAGNVYIIAQHYGVAPQRVSATILISTVISILTVSVFISWVTV